MPTIINVGLTLQHEGAGQKRKAQITFTATFTPTEILAGAVFKANARIISDDNDRSLSVGSTSLKADASPATLTLTKLFDRFELDEDVDIQVVKGVSKEIEKRDEWLAQVTLSPVVFQSASGNSLAVTGSWGVKGTD